VGNPIARSTWLGSKLPDVQAEPLLAPIPMHPSAKAWIRLRCNGSKSLHEMEAVLYDGRSK